MSRPQLPPPSDRDQLADLADTIERVWITRFGKVAVVAQVVLARLRRGEP